MLARRRGAARHHGDAASTNCYLRRGHGWRGFLSPPTTCKSSSCAMRATPPAWPPPRCRIWACTRPRTWTEATEPGRLRASRLTEDAPSPSAPSHPAALDADKPYRPERHASMSTATKNRRPAHVCGGRRPLKALSSCGDQSPSTTSASAFASASASLPDEAAFDEVAALHPNHLSTRAEIAVDVSRVSDSCGWGVPVMEGHPSNASLRYRH